MKVGMLWYDGDTKTDWKQKVQRAARYYEQKHGVSPTTCCVHLSVLAIDETQKVGAILVKSLTTVIKDHWWVGIEGEDVTVATD